MNLLFPSSIRSEQSVINLVSVNRNKTEDLEAYNVSKFLNFLAAFLLVTLLIGQTVLAQNPVAINAATAANVGSATLSTPGAQIASSLASLPEADTIIYINPQRILNEALPKFMPAKDVEDMRKGFEALKTQAGVDPTKVDYIVIAVRFKKPTADLNFQPPEFLAVASGDFNADSLLGL